MQYIMIAIVSYTSLNGADNTLVSEPNSCRMSLWNLLVQVPYDDKVDLLVCVCFFDSNRPIFQFERRALPAGASHKAR